MQQANQALAIGVQEAEIARSAEALGQDMLEDQPQEIGAGEDAFFQFAGFCVAIAKGHLAVRASQDVLFTDNAAIKIAAEVDQRLVAAAGTTR